MHLDTRLNIDVIRPLTDYVTSVKGEVSLRDNVTHPEDVLQNVPGIHNIIR